MLSWASYLFGSSTTEPQQHEQPSEPAKPVAMETEASSDKDWVVVEHKGNGQAPEVGISDLENLLIEHPSMSVYKRSGSAGEESNASDESSNELVTKSKRSQAMNRPSPKRMRAVSARAELLAQVSQVKHAQKVQQKLSTKRNNKRNLDRSNKVASCDKHVTRKNRVKNPSGQMNGRIPQRKQ
ncbi:tumor protein p53-inducible nuclear protein 2-like [Ruditapes philippinarum]|uniref:tumor protein p53-inducible nuclear protein 2-like n=1 Tax=Ruditapes philippinarum TaxID=129788 RepID=UPI00295AE8CD|nr:tumor protein p53-inducible nuclear protein 2-like [Ruditapes philippinarum]XP_060589865.1 tumor protein p53-inducible nuclear protein 2-like [Ruditapes philippinarum]